LGRRRELKVQGKWMDRQCNKGVEVAASDGGFAAWKLH